MLLKPITLILPVVLGGVVLLSSCNSQGYYVPVKEATAAQNDQSKSSSKIKAPDFSLTDLEGKEVSLGNLNGKVIFLDFWATWCPPCVISAPEVEKLHHDYEGDDVEILSVSLDQSEELVRQFMKRMKLTGRVAMAGGSQIDTRYQVTALPSFFIIDKEGYVIRAWNGYHPSLVRDWRGEIDRLIKS